MESLTNYVSNKEKQVGETLKMAICLSVELLKNKPTL